MKKRRISCVIAATAATSAKRRNEQRNEKRNEQRNEQRNRKDTKQFAQRDFRTMVWRAEAGQTAGSASGCQHNGGMVWINRAATA
ncbi:MAG: hypothetical protein H7232_11430 [Aeromicrobium sp.]|nr:hypothetical protein [Burkholderiales bacterium]